MRDFFIHSVYFGTALTFAAYGIGSLIKKKFPYSFVNPLLIAIVIVIPVLLLLKIDYQTYSDGNRYISYLLTPATICLAVPLYEQFEILKRNYKAILAGISSGVLTALLTNTLLALLFRFDHRVFVSILPKSITTAIAIGVTEELGGIVAITTTGIVITGMLGNLTAVPLLRLFKIEEPIAKGAAIGTASHVIGTTKAMEIGPLEGAVSSLSLIVSGILTVIGAGIVSHIVH